MAVCLLKAGAAPDAVNDAGCSALHDAAARGFTWVAMCLLRGGTDPNIKDLRGCTALHLASYYGQVEVMRTLLSRDADFDVVNENGETALHCAAHSGCAEAVQVLLDLGSAIEATTHGKETALHVACRFGKADVVALLINCGANIEARDANGCTPFHLAARATVPPAGVFCSKECNSLRYIWNVAAPCDLCRYPVTGHAEHGVQSSAENAENAVLGCDAKSSDDDSDGEPTISESERSFSKRLGVVQALLGAGADFKATNKKSETVLHYAAIGGHGPTITTLLVEGADLKSLSGSG